MSQKALSVIVPVYNVEQYIEKCVNSILKQVFPILNIILVDDGSTDNSGVLCDLLAEKAKCIKVLHIEHSGITIARLTGVRAADTDWITFVDADDWISEDAYTDLLTCEGSDVVITGICRYIDSKHQVLQMPHFEEKVYDKKQIEREIMPTMLWCPEVGDWALDPSLCTKLFKREIVLTQLEKVSKVGSNYGEDSAVVFPIMLHATNIRICKKIYYFHRQRISGTIAPYIEDEDFISKLHNVYALLKAQFQEAGYWEIMKGQLDCFYINAIELKKRCYEYPLLECSAYFPIDKILPKSKVILYGAGNIGKQYWDQNNLYQFCEIVSWVDLKLTGQQVRTCTIENPESIKKLQFDYVLIAVDNYFIARMIFSYLCELQIRKEKIIWHSLRSDIRGLDNIFDNAIGETI